MKRRAVLADAGLPVEQRAAVGDQVAGHDERRTATRSTTRPADAIDDVEDALDPAVARPGAPRRCRTSATPARARTPAACRATPRRRATACAPARRSRGGSRPDRRSTGSAAHRGRARRRSRRRARTDSMSASRIGSPASASSSDSTSMTVAGRSALLEFDRQRRGVGPAAHDDHTVAGLVPRPAIAGKHRAEPIPGNQDRGRREHDGLEAGGRRPTDELERREREGTGAGGRRCGQRDRPAAPREIREPRDGTRSRPWQRRTSPPTRSGTTR